MQVYGKFGGFALQIALFWVGKKMTRAKGKGKKSTILGINISCHNWQLSKDYFPFPMVAHVRRYFKAAWCILMLIENGRSFHIPFFVAFRKICKREISKLIVPFHQSTFGDDVPFPKRGHVSLLGEDIPRCPGRLGSIRVPR